jgi:hypothetical protein
MQVEKNSGLLLNANTKGNALSILFTNNKKIK